jgi:hypothetical protein
LAEDLGGINYDWQLTEGEGEGGGERVGDVETEEGEEEVDLCTTMDEEEASNLYQDLLGV